MWSHRYICETHSEKCALRLAECRDYGKRVWRILRLMRFFAAFRTISQKCMAVGKASRAYLVEDIDCCVTVCSMEACKINPAPSAQQGSWRTQFLDPESPPARPGFGVRGIRDLAGIRCTQSSPKLRHALIGRCTYCIPPYRESAYMCIHRERNRKRKREKRKLHKRQSKQERHSERYS
jgi:hypothetical protein